MKKSKIYWWDGTSRGEQKELGEKKICLFSTLSTTKFTMTGPGSKASLRSERPQTAWAFVDERTYAVFYCGPNREHPRLEIHSVLV